MLDEPRSGDFDFDDGPGLDDDSHDLDFEDDRLGGSNLYQGSDHLANRSNLPSPDKGTKPSAATSRGRWEQKTVDSLNHAKALTRHAMKTVGDDSVVHGHTERALHANNHTVSHTIKKKIGFTEDLIKALDDRIESVEDTTRQVGECLFQLQRAFRSKWAPLNVCERRLQLRDARPQEELIRDACQEALEQERQTLIESRQELADQIDSLKEMLVTLDKLKAELIDDMQHKRHALRIDRSCLDPKKKIQERLVLPSLQEVVHYAGPPSPKDTEMGSGSRNEENRQVNTKELVAKAVHIEEDAMRLCNECDAVMIHTKRECTRASSQTQSELMRRLEETNHYRKELEVQIRETDEAIARTEMCLAATKKKFESHEQPLGVLDKQFAERTRRTSREEIRDHVHDELEGHLDTMKKNLKTLTEKWQNTKDILAQLRITKQRLQEDYRGKCAAAKIDDACVRCTAKKAMELDRMDPRGGRCREPPGRRKPRDYGAFEAT